LEDYGVWIPSTGAWWIIPSSTGNGYTTNWGFSGAIPVPGDYDGDGKTDLAVWDPATGKWWIIPSSTGNGYTTNWGFSGAIPVPGDYDGDGKTDLAVWDPATGNWWIIPSSTGNGYTTNWGFSGAIPVPGDYDGDGKTDLAVWDPATGKWWIIPSGTGNGYTTNWGFSGAIPVPGDYDGDGKTDLVVWDPTIGNWWVIPSSTGNSYSIAWGASGETPVFPSPGAGITVADPRGSAAVKISGNVSEGGNGLGGVYVSLTGSRIAGTSISLSTNTDANGNYSFSVPAGGTYTLIPSSPASGPYSFSPESQTISNISSNQTVPFTATAISTPTQSDYTINGRVLGNGLPLPGATMSLTAGLQTLTTQTTTSGGYSFVVPSGGSYTITASLSGYAFSPSSQNFTNVTANVIANDFTSPTAPPATTPTTTNFTILINGTLNFGESLFDVSWIKPSDPEYQAIAATFPGTVYVYQWPGTIPTVLPPLYPDIYLHAPALAAIINNHSFQSGERLNIVTHSHGGNVAKLATSFIITHGIDNLITLGAPQNWDITGQIQTGAFGTWNTWIVGNYCQVASFTDIAEWAGSSPTQIWNTGQSQYNAAVDAYYAAEWLNDYFEETDPIGQAIANSQFLYWSAEAASWEAEALYWWLTTRIATDSPSGMTLLFSNYSHGDLHSAPVWSQVVSGCYIH